MLRGGHLPRTEVALIVKIHSVSNGLKAASRRKSLHHSEELVLAMKTARGIIPNVFGPVEFVGTNHLDWNVVFAGEGDSIIELKPRKAWRVGDDGQHVASEGLMTRPREERGISAAGVSD